MARRRKVYVHDFPGRRTASREMRMHAYVYRRSGYAKHGYEVCVHVGSPHGLYAREGRGRVAVDTYECATGPAPRRALGAALKKLGATLVRRSSAFRGT